MRRYIFLLLLLMVGCKAITYQNPELKLYFGRDGITMSFLKNSPPDKVYEEMNFPVAIELKNMGTFDIGTGEASEPGYLLISIEQEYMSITDEFKGTGELQTSGSQSMQFTIPGKSILSPTGEIGVLYGTLTSKKIEPQSETHKTVLTATSCYKYRTRLSSTICVDTDPYSIKSQKKACTNAPLTFQDQGAPIAVTRVETIMTGNQESQSPTFIVTAENKGGGIIIKQDAIADMCSSAKIAPEQLNYVSATAIFNGKEYACIPNTGEELIRFRDGKATFKCATNEPIPSQAAYTASLIVQLYYGYGQTISKDIVIEKVLTR